MRQFLANDSRLRAIAWAELLWVLVLGPIMLLPGRILPAAWHPLLVGLLLAPRLAGVVLAGFAGSRRRKTGHAFAPHSPLTVPIICMLVWLAFTLAIWGALPVVWTVAGYVAWSIALFAALVHSPAARAEPAWVAWFYLLVGCGVAVATIPIVAWKPTFRLFHLPLYDWLNVLHLDIGETIHANILAGVLAMLLPLLLALLFHSHRAPASTAQQAPPRRGGQLPWLFAVRGKFLLSLIFGCLAGLLILTQSRGGYLATAFALPLVIILRWPKLWRIALLALLVVCAAVWWIGAATILDQLSTDGSLGGWQSRLDVWRASWVAIQDFPFTGIGIGAFTVTIPLLYPIPFTVENFPHAHNIFLQVALDLGLPGLIAFLALLINLVVMLIALLRRPTVEPLHRTLAIGAAAALIAMLTHGLMDATTWGVKLAFLPWVLYALISALFVHASAQPESGDSMTLR